MFLIKNHFIYCLILIFIILSGCQLHDPTNTHGITFLENRSKKLSINQSNKNDVIRVFGQPQIIDENNEDNWIYVERVLTKGKYHELGRHKLKENNILLLFFDKYGILIKKEYFSKNEINKISFSSKDTKNDITRKSFIQNLLQSVKQKMYGNR